jgi:hypothetical protein
LLQVNVLAVSSYLSQQMIYKCMLEVLSFLFRNSEKLIPNIFSFLVMLSYEKTHSKSIIAMPKIIQLCDGIMASGLQPVSHGKFVMSHGKLVELFPTPKLQSLN